MFQSKFSIFLAFILFLFKSFISYCVPDHFPIKIGSYGKWSAYYYFENGSKICYIKSYTVDKLTNHNIVNHERNPFISFSIFDNHMIEFYSNFDYGLRLNSSQVLSTGNNLYLLSPDNEYGEISYLIDELSEKDFLMDAINGNYIYIFSRSVYNTYSVDMYSIHGLDKAFKIIKKECKLKENLKFDRCEYSY